MPHDVTSLPDPSESMPAKPSTFATISSSFDLGMAVTCLVGVVLESSLWSAFRDGDDDDDGGSSFISGICA